jgi:ketosteroid isomerase-like protein
VSANLDLVKSIYAQWEQGDWSSAEWADPEIEFEMVGGLQTGRVKGVKEMGEAWGKTVSAFDDLRAIPESFRELDDERVLVLLVNTGRGKGSGIEIDEISTKSANVWTIRDGRVVTLVAYWDRDVALGELGL